MTVGSKIWLASLLGPITAAWYTVPVCHADVGGSVPGPGLCEYPGVGGSGQIMDGYYYTCDFPTEENGSHWHCEWGGGVLTANGSVGATVGVNAGVNVMMFNGGINGGLLGTAGLQGYVGGVVGSCSWRCPDLTLAAQPNPPGAWKDRLTPAKCKSVGPAPAAAAPPAPPALPFAPPPPPESGATPAVTNPQPGNPEATENP